MRSRLGKAAIIACFALLYGCRSKEPVVMIDHWWNVDFAKESCAARERSRVVPCILDPAAEVNQFEEELSTSFAGDPACSGISLSKYDGPQEGAATAQTKADWQVMLNFTSGEPMQDWSAVNTGIANLGKPLSQAGSASGHGAPKEIIHTLCAVINHAGGSVN